MNDFPGYCTAHPLSLPPQRLSRAECDEMFELFASAGLPAAAMPAEMADGYLTACVIGPMPVPAHEWLQAIFGQSTLPICADAQQQERLLELLRHRERDIAVATAVRPQELTPEKLFLPLIGQVADAERITPYQLDEEGNAWASGITRTGPEASAWPSGTTRSPGSNWWTRNAAAPEAVAQCRVTRLKPTLFRGRHSDAVPLT